MKNRFQFGRNCWLGCVVVAALGACGESDASFSDLPSGGSAGSGGSGGWTSLPSSGTNGGGQVGVAGRSGQGSGGHGGSSAGKAGSGGVGGSSQLPPVTFNCSGTVPSQPLITSFDGFAGDRWQSPGNLDGGVYIYPAPLVLAAGEFLGFDAQVKDHTGIGTWFSGCIDASQFKGIRLTVSGNVGSSGTVQLYLITNRDRDVDEGNSLGACVPADTSDPWRTCRPPVVALPVTGMPTVHEIPWAAFKDGLPTATTDGSDLLAFQWSFDWSAASSTAYGATLKVDDLAFLVDDGGGSGGQDGTAGAGTSATGGASEAGSSSDGAADE